MSILKKGKKIKFSSERPDLKEIEVYGARISLGARLNQMVAVACGDQLMFDQLSQMGINTVQMGVRGQTGLGNVVVTKDDGYSFENYMYDINAVINSLNVRQSKLFGYSHGGYYTIAYAVQNPSRVSSLILVEPGWNVPASELKKRAELSMAKDGLAGIEAMLEYVNPNLNRTERTTAAREISADWQSNEAIANGYLVRANNPITKDDLAAIKVPTLLIYGTESKIKEATIEAAKYIPNASLWAIDGADHISIMNSSRYTSEIAEVIGYFSKSKG